ncbi:MAG TPA: ABC transporter substrate-binding protein [Devosia sp.]|nr:ABC transporter substrate-binding protein [Devosia sp.]
MKTLLKLGIAMTGLFAAAPQIVSAAELNMVCSNEQDWCDLMVANFEAKTGIDVSMVRKSTGETLAQVRAEASNPKIDVWWGGTGDPHLIAAAEGLTQPSGVDISNLQDWAKNLAEISGGRTIGIHLGVLGVAYNKELLAEKGLPAPACWADLANPVYKGEIQVANPNSSGTAYTELATVVQVFGEDAAFKLLKQIGENVNQYTKSGSAPSKAAGRGETTISIGFEHDMVKLARAGFPLAIVTPCEGTGYEVGGLSIISGAQNLDEAKQFVEFAISAEAQNHGPEVGVFNIPSNKDATIPPEAPPLETINLINYDFATYGSTETRARLLARWDAEVGDPNN